MAKLLDETREIGWNPRVRPQMPDAHLADRQYALACSVSKQVHRTCSVLLIGNHCHAANCQPARRIGSAPNAADSQFRPARSRYPDYSRLCQETVGGTWTSFGFRLGAISRNGEFELADFHEERIPRCVDGNDDGVPLDTFGNDAMSMRTPRASRQSVTQK